MLKHAFLILTLLCTCAQPAAAQTDAKAINAFNAIKPVPGNDPEFKDPTNAALLYYRAFLLLPEDTARKVGDAVKPDNANWVPDADLSQALIDAQDVSYTLMRAARIESADFGIEYSQGIGALLPHLGKMRNAARFLAADARRLLAASQPDDAADRIVAMFAMSRHINGERLLISALVSIAIHSLGCAQVDYLINSGQLTFAGKKKLLEAMDRFNIPDPFGVRAAVRGERSCVVVWIRNQIAGPDGVKMFMTQIMPLIDDKPESADSKAIHEMDATAINADLDKAEGYYSAVPDAFDAPDAQVRLAALGERVQSGEFGVIARHVVPAMNRAHDSHTKALTRQSEVRARLANAFAR